MSETMEPAPPVIDHAMLRQQVREVADREGLRTRDVANVSGVAYSSLSAFMAETYKGNNDAIAQKLQTWVDSRGAANRTRGALPAQLTFVETPTAAHFLATLVQAQYVPDLVVISGGAGVGKTTACEHHKRTHPNVWMMTAEPAMVTVAAMLEQLAEVMGVHAESSMRRSSGIVRKLIGTGGLLIVDEVQHLPSGALDQLRTIHDKASIGLALVGNDKVHGRIDGSSRQPEYAQIFSRVGMRANRPRPMAKDISVLLDHMGINGNEERAFLAEIGRKPGALRGMMKTLRVAHMLASADDAESGVARGTGDVRIDHLDTAWSRLSNTIGVPASAGAGK